MRYWAVKRTPDTLPEILSEAEVFYEHVEHFHELCVKAHRKIYNLYDETVAHFVQVHGAENLYRYDRARLQWDETGPDGWCQSVSRRGAGLLHTYWPYYRQKWSQQPTPRRPAPTFLEVLQDLVVTHWADVFCTWSHKRVDLCAMTELDIETGRIMYVKE